MKISSKPSETTFSPESQKQIRDIISRALKFRNQANSILSAYLPTIVVEDASRIIEKIFERFHSVALEMNRRHKDRPSLNIQDEYDVQDLMRSLLTMYFDDVRREEPTPSKAGAHTRMDLLLKREQIVIEAKMTRNGMPQKKIREELIVDKAYYKAHKDCKKLYCFVYDPSEKIRNPRGFEEDLSDVVEEFRTKVFVFPRRV
jgi:hypothetical protein